MEGSMKGKWTRGRRRVGMIDDLREGTSYETLKRRAQDQAGWRSYNYCNFLESLIFLMHFSLKYIVTLFYKKVRIKIVVCLLHESGPRGLKAYY